MHEFIPTAALAGEVLLDGKDIYAPGTDVTKIRLRVGMVFQKPNPFPKSIFDNIAYGPRVTGMKLNKTEVADLVEHALNKAGLWAEVKDKLDQSGFALSGGQQQRLCIARAIATSPDILLMDEPCASLDPIATSLIEDLMLELVNDYTVVIVTHNMQQAARVSDRTAFFSAKVDDEGQRFGHLVEMDQTSKIFTNPSDSRTEDYISGRFG
jgi:phosphate transport system ATP-binding protein